MTAASTGRRTRGTDPFSDEDHAAARELLALAAGAGDGIHVVTLTDEELSVLDPSDLEPATVLPWLSGPDAVASAARVALRSLRARGLVRSRGVDDDRLAAAPEIAASLVLRRTADRLFAVHRETAAGDGWWYGYRHGGALLEEDVHTDGYHRFGLHPAARTAGRLAIFLDPQGRARRAGAATAIKRADLVATLAAPPFSDAVVVTTLTRFEADSDEATVVAVYSGPSGVVVLRGAGADRGDDELVATAVDGPGLVALLDAVLFG